MKRKKHLLKEFVKATLEEDAKSVDSVDVQKMALLKKDGNHTAYVLFNPKKAAQAIYDAQKEGKSLDDIEDKLVASVFGFMLAKAPPGEKQLGAWEIAASSAVKGYGPLMYDIVMSDKGAITPDRYVVSNDAQKVWKYYHDRRSDVKHKEFDDEQNPKTPPKEDDAKLHKGGAANALNYAYSGAHVAVSSLESTYKKFLQWATKGGLDAEKVSSAIQFAGNMFFRKLAG